MVFIAYGLNHKTAPIKLREKVALTDAHQDILLNQLLEDTVADEAAILSTCNRTEIYCDTHDPERLTHWFSSHYAIPKSTLAEHIYMYPDQAAVKHTLRVASGLDSMMLGEPQIFGQMKHAFQRACRAGTIKTHLRPIFEYIFKASKRIRTKSGIGENPISIAYAAAQSIAQAFPQLSQKRVLIIGSGDTASLVAKYLQDQGVSQFLVTSRTHEHASQLADKLQGTPVSILDLAYFLTQVDIVITATACPIPFITKQLIQDTLTQKLLANLFILDLAVPRNVEPEVAKLTGVTLNNIDDLQATIAYNISQRQHAAITAEQLVEGEMQQFIRWHNIRSANQVIAKFRQTMSHLAQQELARSIKQLGHQPNPIPVLEELCYRMIQKLTHIPSLHMKEAAATGAIDTLQLISSLYDTSSLEGKESHEEIA